MSGHFDIIGIEESAQARLHKYHIKLGAIMGDNYIADFFGAESFPMFAI